MGKVNEGYAMVFEQLMKIILQKINSNYGFLTFGIISSIRLQQIFNTCTHSELLWVCRKQNKAVMWLRQGYILNSWATGSHRTTNNHHTSMDNLLLPYSPHVFGLWGKPDNSKRTYGNTNRTCKLHAHKGLMRPLLLNWLILKKKKKKWHYEVRFQKTPLSWWQEEVGLEVKWMDG